MQKQEQHLTPEQLKAMKGPSRDDPLEAEGAASWVQQFNEELAATSRNALECESQPLFLFDGFLSHALACSRFPQLSKFLELSGKLEKPKHSVLHVKALSMGQVFGLVKQHCATFMPCQQWQLKRPDKGLVLQMTCRP